MGFNFPNAPTVNQTYTPVNGPTYTWTGSVWAMTGTSGVATADSTNRVVNGAMQHSQENSTTNGTTNGYHPADQWYGAFSGLTMSMIQKGAATSASPFNYVVMQSVVKASLAATDFYYLGQKIEGAR